MLHILISTKNQLAKPTPFDLRVKVGRVGQPVGLIFFVSTHCYFFFFWSDTHCYLCKLIGIDGLLGWLVSVLSVSKYVGLDKKLERNNTTIHSHILTDLTKIQWHSLTHYHLFVSLNRSSQLTSRTLQLTSPVSPHHQLALHHHKSHLIPNLSFSQSLSSLC